MSSSDTSGNPLPSVDENQVWRTRIDGALAKLRSFPSSGGHEPAGPGAEGGATHAEARISRS